MRRNRKWKIRRAPLGRSTLCFNSYKNHELKANLSLAGSRKRKKSAFSVTFILSEGDFFNIFVLSQCTVYSINFQNIYILLRIKKHYLIHCYCLFLKSSKAFIVSLSNYADDVIIIYSVGENHKTNRNILNIIFLFLQK